MSNQWINSGSESRNKLNPQSISSSHSSLSVESSKENHARYPNAGGVPFREGTQVSFGWHGCLSPGPGIGSQVLDPPASGSTGATSLVSLIEQFKQMKLCTPFGKRGLDYASLVKPKIKSRRFEALSTNALDKLRSDGKKRRSSWFFLANSQFKRIRDLGFLEIEKLDLLDIYYEKWMESYHKKYVHLEKDLTHVFIKQYSRFDWDYKAFLRRKLRLLNFMLWDLKIELTVDPKKCMRYSDEFYLLQKGWNRLRSWLKRRYGEFSYFKVMEITKKGRPHDHILISGIKWIDQGELSDLWSSYGCGEIVYVKRVHSRNNLKMCAYVMKYVNKTLDSEDRRYSAVLFASNRRLFSMSKGCQSMINAGKTPKEPKGFEFRGSVHDRELIEFCDEKGIQIEAFMVIEAETSDFYEFPNLFGVNDHG